MVIKMRTCYVDVSGFKRHTEGDEFLCNFKYVSSKCFQSVVCIEHLHLLLKANFCEEEMYSCV